MIHTGSHLSGVSVGAGLALLALALGVGCTPPPALDAAPAEAQTLYERLGGLPAITAVVDNFIGRLKKDPVVKDRFEALNVPRFREKLIEQVGEISGGPRSDTPASICSPCTPVWTSRRKSSTRWSRIGRRA
jgi:hypothetical protein